MQSASVANITRPPIGSRLATIGSPRWTTAPWIGGSNGSQLYKQHTKQYRSKNKMNQLQTTAPANGVGKQILTPMNDLFAGALDIIAAAPTIQVVDEVSAEAAADHARVLYSISKGIESKRVEYVKPYNDEATRINAYAKALKAKLDPIESDLRRKSSAWREAEARRIEEINRKAREEAEAERQRVEAANRAAIAEAERAADEIVELAEIWGEEPPAELPAPVLEAPPPPVALAAAPVKMVPTRKTIVCEIVDLKKIPREILEELAGNELTKLQTICKRWQAGGKQVAGATFREETIAIRKGY